MGTKLIVITRCWLLVLLISACASTVDELRANQEQGRKIVQAINQYAQDHSQLPEHLDGLTPNYLSTIPKTVAGRDFTYTLSSLDGYLLCFEDGGKCCYLQRHKLWDCSPGD